jgi:D-amino-acid dehydrogenase
LTSPDALVIGGGVVGLFCAYHLRRGGASVTVLERGPIGGPQSCSSGNTGFLGTHGAPVPELMDLKRESLALVRELGVDAFAAPGMILAYRTEQAFDEACRTVPALVARGIPMRVLDTGELSTLEPSVSAHGGLCNEEGAYVRVPEFLQELAKVVAGMGVELHQDTEALDVEVTGRAVRQVRTTRGDFRPAEVVLAAGVWSAGLAGLDLDLPIEPVRGHSFTVKGPALRHPVTLGAGDETLALAPIGAGFRVGGGRERVGFDGTVHRQQVDSMLQTVRAYLPDLGNVEATEVWTGLRPSTPDGVPIIGRVPGYENLSIACGHGHIGMGLAPAGGRLLAERVLGRV